MPKAQSADSLDDFLIPVDLVIAEGANPDPAADVVEFQFVLGGLPPRAQPTDDGWVAGRWITRETGVLLAAVLVGPGGGVALARGRWAAWIRVVDSPTVPVVPVDVLTIF